MMAFLNEKRTSKSLMAAILIITMVMTYAMPMTVYAAVSTGSEGQIVKGNVKSDMTVSNSDQSVTISKTIAGTNTENEFEITLEVQTKNEIKQNKINAVLVIDTSGSMSDNSRLTKAKAAAKSFVETILSSSTSAENVNKVGLVSFGETVKAGQGQALTNQRSELIGSDGNGGKISGLSADGGTNIQAGIKAAQDMLSNGDADAQKFIILLSDGTPTFSYKGTQKTANAGSIVSVGTVSAPSYRITAFNTDQKGNGKEYILSSVEWGKHDNPYEIGTGQDKVTVSNNGIPTISQAILAKQSGIEIYAIGCELADQDYYYSYEVNYKRDAVFTLTNCASGSDHYFDVANSANLVTVFQNISQQVLETKAGTITDPMGDNILFDQFVTNPDNSAEYNATTKEFTWNLAEVTPTKNGQIYTYTLKYKVKLDTEADGFTANTPYKTNKTTTLTYLTPAGTEQSLDFISPEVKGQLPKYEVIVEYYVETADGTRTLLPPDDYNQNLGQVVKGTTFESAAALVKDAWYGTGTILESDYDAGIIQDPTNTVSSTNKIIEVVYKAKAKAPYAVEFYYDTDLTAPFETTTSAISYLDGDVIEKSDIDDLITAYRPANWYFGSMDPTVLTISTAEGASNIIKVIYTEDARYSYTVEYYYDGIIDSELTTMPAVSYYAGAEIGIDDIDVARGNKAGYEFNHAAWGADGENVLPLVISAESNNVIKVYYTKVSGLSFTVNHYLQNDDDTYPAVPTETERGAGTFGETISASEFAPGYQADHTGYSFNETKSDSSAQIGESGAVLNLYYDQVKAPLIIKHTYIGDSSLDKRFDKEARIGSAVYVTQSREYGYVLADLLVNGGSLIDEGGSVPSGYEDSMPENGLEIEFIYEKVNGSIQITRHYTNLTTGATGEAITTMGPTTSAINLIGDEHKTFGGKVYELVSLVINSQIVETIEAELRAAIEDLIAARDQVKVLYQAVADLVTTEEKSDAQGAYNEAIADEEAALDAATKAFQLKESSLAADKDAASADEKTGLDAAQAAYDDAVRTLTPEGITIDMTTATYAGIIAAYDAEISKAEKAVGAAEAAYDKAVQDAIKADPGVAAAQALLDSAEDDLESAQDALNKAKADLSGADPDVDDMDSLQAAVSAAETAVTDAQAAVGTAGEALNNAITAVDRTTVSDAAVTDAEAALALLRAQKEAFENAEASLTEKTALGAAAAAYESAKTEAWNAYNAALKASDEYKNREAAQNDYEEADHSAKKALDLAIREIVKGKEGGADLVADLEEAEKALSDAQIKLDDAVNRSGKKAFDAEDLTDAEILALLGGYVFDEDLNYQVDVYYEYEDEPSNPGNPQDPDKPNRPSRPDNPVIIKDDEVPAAPVTPIEDVVVLDDQVPAGPLPKTGGLDALLLYGLGALLAGGGIALRRREKNK